MKKIFVFFTLLFFTLSISANSATDSVRNYSTQDNPAAILDDLEFLLKQGRKDSTTVIYLLSAASYFGKIGDMEGRYNCLATAYTWVKQDPTLKSLLSKDIYFALLEDCTMNYYPHAKPIVLEVDLFSATEYIHKTFGTQSIQAYQYEVAKISYYDYIHNTDKAIDLSERLISSLDSHLNSTRCKSTEQETLNAIYVISHWLLSNLYAQKYPYFAINYSSFLDDNKTHSPSAEQLLPYSTIKKILDNPKFNKNLHVEFYNSFIYLCYQLNKIGDIWTYIPRYFELTRQNVDNALTSMSDKDALLWWNSRRPFFYDNNIILGTNYSAYPSNIPGEIYNNELFKKDILLRTNKRLRQYITETGDDTIIHLYDQVISQKAQLLQMQAQKYLDDSITDAFRKSIASNERQLAFVSNAYAQHKNEQNITWNNIQAKLHENDVAIEFINAGAVDQYWALILRKEYKEPKLVYLKDFKRYYLEDIKSQMDSWKQYMEPFGMEPPKFLQFNGDAGEVYKYGKDENGTKLYETLWIPLTQYIKEGDRVYFAPSGVLLQLSIEALPVDSKTVLSDHYNLIRLSSTKEIAIPYTQNSKKEAVLYGNIQYGIDDVDAFIAESDKYQNRFPNHDNINVSNRNRASVKPLYGTKIEVTGISKLLSKAHFKFKVFESYNANEESFKALSGNSPQILHVATHGFYWDNDRASNEPFVEQTTPQGTTMVDPLMRCGLLFSGANDAYSGRQTVVSGRADDGILTAKEISLLDLSNTKLLVLSACETGLGELTDAGVFGLQRAFKQAGAQTLVMSLWKVDDKATQLLMTEFYRNLISKHQSKREAFHNAQNHVRSQYKDPYYWAGFIMLD